MRHEAELAEKSSRLAVLNAMLNMDERSPVETLGVDEETDQSINGGKTERVAARSADSLPVGKTFAEWAEDLKMRGRQEQGVMPGKASLRSLPGPARGRPPHTGGLLHHRL